MRESRVWILYLSVLVVVSVFVVHIGPEMSYAEAMAAAQTEMNLCWQRVLDAHEKAFAVWRKEKSDPSLRLKRIKLFDAAFSAVRDYLRTKPFEKDTVEYLNLIFRWGWYMELADASIHARRAYLFCKDHDRIQAPGASWNGAPLADVVEMRIREINRKLDPNSFTRKKSRGTRTIITEVVSYSVPCSTDSVGYYEVFQYHDSVTALKPLEPLSHSEALEVAMRQWHSNEQELAIASGKRLLSNAGITYTTATSDNIVVFGVGGKKEATKLLVKRLAEAQQILSEKYFDVIDQSPLLVVYANLMSSSQEAVTMGQKLCTALHFHDNLPYQGYFEPLDNSIILRLPMQLRKGGRELKESGLRLDTAYHQLVFSLIYLDFPLAPQWIKEGLAALYEVGPMPNPPDNYRLGYLFEAQKLGMMPEVRTLLAPNAVVWQNEEGPLYRALARYFCLYLLEKRRDADMLSNVYRELRSDFSDGTLNRPSEEIISAIVGLEWAAIEDDFTEYVKTRLGDAEVRLYEGTNIDEYIRSIATDVRISGVRKMRQLQRLDLSHTKITDSGLMHLAELDQLKLLDLSNTQISGTGLSHLKKCTGLEVLDLGESHISDNGLERLPPLPNLKQLGIYRTRISDVGLVYLRKMPKLEHVNANLCRVSDAGVKKLTEALPGVTVSYWSNPTIGKGYTQIEDEAELEFLRGFEALNSLSLFDSKITDLAMKYVQEHTSLKELRLDGTGVGNDGIKLLRNLKNLEELNLSNTRVSNDGLYHLGGLPNLAELWLTGLDVGDNGLSHLRGLSKMRRLCLDGTGITDEGLVYLVGFKNLWGLYLTDTQVSDKGLAQLEELSELSYLELEGTRVTVAGVLRLAQVLSKPYISFPNGVLYGSMSQLYLHDVTASDLKHLKEIYIPLDRLELSGEKITDAGLENLMGMSNLRQLILSDTQVSSEAVEKLAEALPQCKIIMESENRKNEVFPE